MVAALGLPRFDRLLLVVDPEHETVTVYRCSREGYVVGLTAGRTDSVRAPPFEDIELRIAELFGG